MEQFILCEANWARNRGWNWGLESAWELPWDKVRRAWECERTRCVWEGRLLAGVVAAAGNGGKAS